MNKTPRLQASDFDPRILKLFDLYVHGAISRSHFLHEVEPFVRTGFDAQSLLDALSPKFSENIQVPADDPRIESELVEFASPEGNGRARGYLARPSNNRAQRGAVLVVHENRGLNPHIEDVTRRLAAEGFLALAPDALFTLGGYPGDEDRARELFTRLDRELTLGDFVAASELLRTHAESNGKVGVVGFCYGGGVAHQLATRVPTLRVAIPFYGMAPSPEQASQVRAVLQVHLAAVDERINASWPAYETALRAAGAQYEVHTYPNTQHGFHNDTTPRYDHAAAQLAWGRTVALLRKHLSVPPSPTTEA